LPQADNADKRSDALMHRTAAAVGIVSPHLDDAALSCGQLLRAHPRSQVVTVFSAGPAKVDPLPEWDALCGVFAPGDDVMAVRRKEDDDALALVSAEPHRLGFWEIQYRRPPLTRAARVLRRLRPNREDQAALLTSIVAEVLAVVDDSGLRRWFVPLGLVHPDHAATAAACLRVAAARPALEWFVYEELPYGVERPELVRDALSALAQRGWEPAPTEPEVDSDLPAKRTLVECYRSQLRCLAERADRAVAGPESYHRIRPGSAAA
jgi:LmbE family N-acetylglucosaminyl deacetylase